MMATQLRICGIVQGVGYRASFEARAHALGLSGWVRNRADGSVEAMVAGNEETIRQIIAWAWRGPSGAQVRDVSITIVDDAPITDGRFEVLSTR
jgi:acylphosphatase